MAQSPDVSDLVHRFARTRLLAAKVLQDHPNDVKALFGAGAGFRLSGDYHSALTAFSRADSLQPKNALILFELGNVQEFLGQFEKAADSYRNALRSDPTSYKAQLALVMLETQTGSQNFLSTMEAQFQGRDEDGWRTLHLGHAISKTWEDLGDLQKSFEWLVKGKRRRRSIRKFNEHEQRDMAKAARATFDIMAAGRGHLSREPIFIVGLPRTGTTLVDRILSSHPTVSSAGEIPNFIQLFKRLTGVQGKSGVDADVYSAANRIDPSALGQFYVQSTRPLTGHRQHFIDKAPSNYLIAGAILRALPNSRIICLRRHPLDTCIGNFKQIFPIDDPYYDYVYDLESTAKKFVLFDEVVKSWRDALPRDRFLELSYESLVQNQEPETRRLLAFCDLEWDDRCLNFHENSTAVSTPSAKQVRSTIFSSAIGRWNKYGELINPARDVLSRAGLL